MSGGRPAAASLAGLVARPLAATDLDAVHAIERAASLDPWSRALFADELAGSRGDRHWLVAVDGSQVVGFGGVMLIADEAHVMNLAVRSAHRRRGIAAGLVADLLLEAGDRGAVAATLEVRSGNGPAIALYRRFGFAGAGRRPGYYPDGEDAEIMWLHRLHDRGVRARLEAASSRWWL